MAYKNSFTLVLLLSCFFLTAQTGIGTTAPVNKLQVETATAEPATTGLAANGNLRLSGTTGSHVLDFGLSSAATYSWLQSRDKSNYATNYNLVLNANGGNVGIGTTTPSDRLIIGSAFALHDGGDKVIGLGWSPGSNKALLSSYPAEIRFNPDSGRLSFGTSSSNFTAGSTVAVQQRMAITSQGYVGIGNSSPNATLELGSTNGTVPGFLILNPTTSGSGIEGAEIDFRPAPIATSPAAQTWVIDQVSNDNKPRLRVFPGTSGENYGFSIKDNGFMGIGVPDPISKLHIKSDNSVTMYIESTTTDNNGMMVLNAKTDQNWSTNYHEFMLFQKQGSSLGYIGTTTNGTAILYAANSDYRLKNDLKNFNGLDLINQIKIYDFAWKENGSRMHGVMAHELQEVVPYAVGGVKDETNPDGSMKIQAVDYSKLTPILTKAIQEQDLKIKEQQKQIEALIQRIEQLETKK